MLHKFAGFLHEYNKIGSSIIRRRINVYKKSSGKEKKINGIRKDHKLYYVGNIYNRIMVEILVLKDKIIDVFGQ